MNLPAMHRAQAGLIADMDYVADVLYGRVTKRSRRASVRPRGRAETSYSGGFHAGHRLSGDGDRRDRGDDARCPNVPAFWNNIKTGRYSISEVTPDRWDSALYYDPDHNAPDKTYSKIGGWVREYPWDPFQWRMAIPPRVADAMDGAQRWAIACTREALADYGYPERPLNTERTAVILGNALGGEMQYLTSLRAFFPEYARELEESDTFAALPAAVRRDITREWHARLGGLLPPITEDSMPGELSNCLAGRIANVYNFRGPNSLATPPAPPPWRPCAPRPKASSSTTST